MGDTLLGEKGSEPMESVREVKRKSKVNIQPVLYCMVHNIGKIMSAFSWTSCTG